MRTLVQTAMLGFSPALHHQIFWDIQAAAGILGYFHTGTVWEAQLRSKTALHCVDIQSHGCGVISVPSLLLVPRGNPKELACHRTSRKGCAEKADPVPKGNLQVLPAPGRLSKSETLSTVFSF